MTINSAYLFKSIAGGIITPFSSSVLWSLFISEIPLTIFSDIVSIPLTKIYASFKKSFGYSIPFVNKIEIMFWRLYAGVWSIPFKTL